MKSKMLIALFAAGIAVMGCGSTQNTSDGTDSVTTIPTPADTTMTDTTMTDTSMQDTGMRDSM